MYSTCLRLRPCTPATVPMYVCPRDTIPKYSNTAKYSNRAQDQPELPYIPSEDPIKAVYTKPKKGNFGGGGGRGAAHTCRWRSGGRRRGWPAPGTSCTCVLAAGSPGCVSGAGMGSLERGTTADILNPSHEACTYTRYIFTYIYRFYGCTNALLLPVRALRFWRPEG